MWSSQGFSHYGNLTAKTTNWSFVTVKEWNVLYVDVYEVWMWLKVKEWGS